MTLIAVTAPLSTVAVAVAPLPLPLRVGDGHRRGGRVAGAERCRRATLRTLRVAVAEAPAPPLTIGSISVPSRMTTFGAVGVAGAGIVDDDAGDGAVWRRWWRGPMALRAVRVVRHVEVDRRDGVAGAGVVQR